MESDISSIREVWSSNLKDELQHLQAFLLQGFKFLTFDTEFPGFLRNAGKNASPEERYSDMRYNVNRMKLIQLGITISDDDGNVGGVWEFNFSDFDEQRDNHAPESIRLLKKQGIDFDDLRKKGIWLDDFRFRFTELIRPYQDLSWVNFHGIYDVGYLVKLLTKTEIPESVEDFRSMVDKVLGSVCDVKYMAGLCEGFEKVEIGLQRLAKFLKVERTGTAHCAGSDSLLTQSVFAMIRKRFSIPRESFEGFLYGLDFQILPALWTQRLFEMMIEAFNIPSEHFKGLLYGVSFQIQQVYGGSDEMLTPLAVDTFLTTSDTSPEFVEGCLRGQSFEIVPDDEDADSWWAEWVWEMMRNRLDTTGEHLEGFVYALCFQILRFDAASEISFTKAAMKLLLKQRHIPPALFYGFVYGLTFQAVPLDVDFSSGYGSSCLDVVDYCY